MNNTLNGGLNEQENNFYKMERVLTSRYIYIRKENEIFYRFLGE